MSQEERTDATYQSKQSAPDRPRLKWTIMIYLAGDNNLSANSLSVLQQLEAANIPRNSDVRVLACYEANTPRPRGARYLEIKHGRFENHPQPDMYWGLHNDLVKYETLRDEFKFQPVATPSFCDPPPTTIPETLDVVKTGLSRFLEYALKKHRADRYMLILYGHGTAVAGNTFLADNNPPSFLRLRDFAEVLACHFDVRDDTEQRGDVGEANAECEPAYQGKPDPENKPGYKRKPALDILACDNCIMNGIEAGYEVKGQVKYVLGSQGLALAVGWPFRKIINAVVRHRNEQTARVAERLLRVCARSLIDFTLMDRSSEQSLCDLTTLHYQPNLVWAVRGLSKAMQKGLKVKPKDWGKDEDKEPEEQKEDEENKIEAEDKQVGEVIYPAIRDAVRSARLEAQSYWGERFVDLYDFCALLLEKCNENLKLLHRYRNMFVKDNANLSKAEQALIAQNINLREIPIVQRFEAIANWCEAVLREIKTKKFVLKSYYIGPALQYSNGVSIFFPWTLPEQPIIFEPVDEEGKRAFAGSYGISWAGLSKFKGKIPKKYAMKTAFDEYKTYKFAERDGGDWSNFLVSFFKATLRDVRRFEYRYVKPKREDAPYFFKVKPKREILVIPPERIDLQKSGSDNDSEEDCTCPEIKNYPRRFYISPADCERICPEPHVPPKREEAAAAKDNAADEDKKPCASYLGWNIRGLVAEVIHLKGSYYGGSDTQGLAETDKAEELDFDETDSDESDLEGAEDDDLEESEE